MYKIINGDCLEEMKKMQDNSVDSIVTDPPYGLKFMNKKWDCSVPSVEIWKDALRVLKPGGYLLCFASTRTQHRMTVNIEDAGFEIRDMIMYVYGSGFPKSHNIFKALTKRCQCGNMVEYDKDRNVQGLSNKQETEHDLRLMQEADISQKIPDRQTEGEVLQSSLSKQGLQIQQSQSPENVRKGKSCMEGRNNTEKNSRELSGNNLPKMSKKISINGKEGRIHNATQISNGSTFRETVNKNGSSTSQRPQSTEQSNKKPCAFCKQYGTQALRSHGIGSALKPSCEPITVARKPLSEKNLADNFLKHGTGGINIDGCRIGSESLSYRTTSYKEAKTGEFSSQNQINHTTGHKEVQGRFPANLIHDGSDEVEELFPNSKAGKYKGCGSKSGGIWDKSTGKPAGQEYGDSGSAARFFYCAKASKKDRGSENNHPTVKPTKLMQYLVRLVTPKNGTVLDPFMGSGSTGKAAKIEKFNFVGIELSKEDCEIAEKRIKEVL